jgi:hypothetical protein
MLEEEVKIKVVFVTPGQALRGCLESDFRIRLRGKRWKLQWGRHIFYEICLPR